MSDKATTGVNVLTHCPGGRLQCDIMSQLEALRLEVRELSELVRTDTLTGLYNYRHFIQALALEMERTRRTRQSTALIMLDLDYFKKVNDEWGHDAGNQALISTANVLRQTTRQLDIPCRYGGEEFAIILPSVDLIVSKQVAERIRESVESTGIVIDGKTLELTASLGIALYDGNQSDVPEDFIKRADQYLYQAKEQGRNQVCHEIQELDEAGLSVNDDEKDALFDLFGQGG